MAPPTEKKVMGAAVSEDKFLESMRRRHKTRLKRAIKRLESKMVTLMKDIKTSKSGRVEGTKVNLKQTQKIHKEMLNLFEQEYGGEVKGLIDEFDSISKHIQRSWRSLGESLEFTGVDKDLIRTLKSQTFSEYEAFGLAAQNKIAEAMYGTMTGGLQYSDLLKQVQGALTGHKDVRGRSMLTYADQHAFDSVMNFQNQVNIKKAEDLGFDHFMYVGDVISTSRPFCISRAGKVFSKEEIEGWNKMKWKGKAGPPMTHRGGYNCRHHWRAVREDWFEEDIEVGDYFKEAEQKEEVDFLKIKETDSDDVKRIKQSINSENKLKSGFRKQRLAIQDRMRVLRKIDSPTPEQTAELTGLRADFKRLHKAGAESRERIAGLKVELENVTGGKTPAGKVKKVPLPPETKLPPIKKLTPYKESDELGPPVIGDDYIDLYHVTFTDNVDSILKQGFKASAENQIQGFESAIQGVYGWATERRAAMEVWRSIDEGLDEASNYAIIKVRVPIKKFWKRLRPDEDWSDVAGEWKDSYNNILSVAVEGDVESKYIVEVLSTKPSVLKKAGKETIEEVVEALKWKQAKNIDQLKSSMREMHVMFPDMGEKVKTAKDIKNTIKQANKVGKEFERLYEQFPGLERIMADSGLDTIKFDNLDYIPWMYKGQSTHCYGIYFPGQVRMRLPVKDANFVHKNVMIGQNRWNVSGGHSYHFGHELGHHVDYNMDRPFRERWSDVISSRNLTEWKRRISVYGGSNPRELFAESFAAYTSPRYGVAERKLPEEMESFFKDLLGA